MQFVSKGDEKMSYDKSTDFKSIQADVLTVNTTDNELISSLKQLKTDNKSVTKAINALNEQLGNAQTSASDAVARVVELETVVTQLQAQLAGSNNDGQETGGDAGDDTSNETGDETGNETGGNTHWTAEHVIGMVLVEEGNKSGTWVRVDKDFNTVEFNPEHGTWAGMKQVQNETYGEFTEIPVTYVRTETLQSGPYAGKNCWWISDEPEDGFHVHPAFIGQDGQPHNLQIASWIASNKNNMPFSEDKGNGPNGYWNKISYNTMHTKGWMTGGIRPYNIYDHHFLARMMLVEFGTPDVQAQTVDGVAWTGDNRISYHGIHDPFGTPNFGKYYWLDGLTTLNGTYQVLAADGSGNMIETGIRSNAKGWPVNCWVDQANGIDFGDLFIANAANDTENSGSFADYQDIYKGCAFYMSWNNQSRRGAFFLTYNAPTDACDALGWRVARCS